MKVWLSLMLVSLAGMPALHAQTVEYIHTDALGSPVAVTNSAGVVIERREYEPYGKQTQPALANGPGYTGHVSDAATGLDYMQQRYYDPQIGRFLSVDPVAARPVGDNFNRYRYANNNPYKFTDPDGRESGAGYATGEYTMAMPTDTDSANIGVAAAATIYGGAVAPVAGEVVGAIRTAVSIRNAVSEEGGGKSNTTYTRAKEDGTVYSGRTSGKGTPEQQVAARTSRPDHQAKTAEGYGPAKVDKNSPNTNAIRGREQQLIERNGGAQSQGGTSGNKINGVSPSNPKVDTYRAACRKEFGC